MTDKEIKEILLRIENKLDQLLLDSAYYRSILEEVTIELPAMLDATEKKTTTGKLPSQTILEKLESHKVLISQYMANLNVLEEQVAIFGGKQNSPPKLQNDIRLTEEKIAALKSDFEYYESIYKDMEEND